MTLKVFNDGAFSEDETFLVAFLISLHAQNADKMSVDGLAIAHPGRR
jgi:hypothetical protein